MAAQLRDYYLSNLGITQYVPKEFVVVAEEGLPAASTEALLAETEPSKAEPQSRVTDSASTARDIASQLSEPATAKPVVDKAEAVEKAAVEPASQASSQPKPQATVEAEPQSVSADVQFRIASWQPAADLLVFSSLDYGQNPQQDQHQLLTNILRAVKRLASPLREPELHDWPVVPNAPADEAGAKAMFSEFLNTKVAHTQAKWVLIMGERAQQYLLAGADQSARLPSGATVIATSGLDEMLAEPSCKREAWAALQPLVAADSDQ